jgi:hypothetical protein
MDSVAGIITLSAPVEAARLEQWRARIERRYGKVETQVQGSQRMMQWVRRGRMLRLTWRTDRKGITASVSLVLRSARITNLSTTTWMSCLSFLSNSTRSSSSL